MSDDKFGIPESLEKALKAGEVVPFVGAGVSLAVRKKNEDGTESKESLFPSWKGYVEILAQTLIKEGKPHEANLVEAYIKSAKLKYLEAMQHAFEELPKPVWYQKLNESFKTDESEAAQDSLELPKLIWQLGSNIVFTTNIDRVLEWKSVKEPPVEQLNRQNVEFAELQADKNPPPTIFYLHGRAGDNENIVFTRKQYDAFYKNHENEAKLRTLQAFLTTKSFLFIGFSLDDAYFVEELQNIREIYKSGAKQYYALIKKSEAGKLKDFDFVTEVYFEDVGEPLLEVVREMRDIAREAISGDKIPPTLEPDKKIFFNVPYNSKGKEFVGRIGKLEEIRDLLGRNGVASIGQAVNVKGFGGLGKTQLAVEYAHEYRSEYKNGVFWLVADQPIDNQLLQIADRKGWINQHDKTVNQIDVAKAKFLELSDCLILFDNVETYDDIKTYLPKTDLRTHILITSREKLSAFRQVDLELLGRDESRELLLKISNRNLPDEPEKEHLENTLETLGDIPLAIELVGGYLAEHETVTFAKYHQFLDEVPLDQLEKEFPEGSFTNHDRSFIQSLRISEETIEEKPLMVEILKVLAWSGSSSMGISLLQALVEAESDFEFETALGDAYKLRLLKRDEDAERYAVHRLLAKVIRHEEPIEKQNEWHQKIAGKLESWFNERKNEFNYLAEFEAEIEHLNEWQNHTVKYLPEQSVWLIALESNPLWQRGNYRKSLQLLEKSFSLYESEKVNNIELLANIQNDLGVLNDMLGNHHEALKYEENALKLRKELFGDKHSDTAISYNNIGDTYRELGKYHEALKYQAKALELQKELFGDKHTHTATSYNNVGAIYADLGKYREALKYQVKALELQKELFGDKHAHTATSYNNVGLTYRKSGKHQEALKYQVKALELRKELLGEKHPDTADSYNNLGYTYGELGKYQKALKYQEKSVELLQELLGKQHPNTIVFAANLIDTYSKFGYKDKAGKKAAEFLGYVPQNHPNWKAFEEISRPYRAKKKRHSKRKH